MPTLCFCHTTNVDRVAERLNEQERVARVKALAKQHESTKQQDVTKQIIYESLRGRRQLIRVRCVNCLFVIVSYVGAMI